MRQKINRVHVFKVIWILSFSLNELTVFLVIGLTKLDNTVPPWQALMVNTRIPSLTQFGVITFQHPALSTVNQFEVATKLYKHVHYQIHGSHSC